MKPEKKTTLRRKAVAQSIEESVETKPSRLRVRRVARAGAASRSGPAGKLKSEAKSKQKSPRRRAASATPAVRKRRLKVPPILLEGDEAPAPAAGGPGQRYALGP